MIGFVYRRFHRDQNWFERTNCTDREYGCPCTTMFQRTHPVELKSVFFEDTLAFIETMEIFWKANMTKIHNQRTTGFQDAVGNRHERRDVLCPVRNIGRVSNYAVDRIIRDFFLLFEEISYSKCDPIRKFFETLSPMLRTAQVFSRSDLATDSLTVLTSPFTTV